MKKIIRVSTISKSLNILLRGQLRFLNKYFEVIGVSGFDEDLRQVSVREAIRVESVPMKRQISIFNDLISTYRLYKLFLRERPLIVHSITPKAGLLSMAAAFLARVPIRIHTFTGLIFPSKDGLYQILLINMDRLLCFFATHIYPEGRGVMKDLKEYQITRKPLKIIGNGNINGIDLEYFNPKFFSKETVAQYRKEYNIGVSDFVFIFVGRLVGDKGINELISAFIKFDLPDTDIKLILVGNFEDELDPLRIDIVEEIKTNQNIISVGFQEDIRPFLCLSDVMVFPSYREGFPNVVIQAGAMDVPCIVTDINGSNEIIVDGLNGFIVPSRSVELLFDKMLFLFLNRTTVNDMSKSSRKLIADKFDQNFLWNELLMEYNKITHV